MNGYHTIIDALPYTEPFLFVDTISHMDDNGVKGHFHFNEGLDFYKGHFKENPVTPGVILTECCAQIGLVCLGIFLCNKENTPENADIALSESQMEFLRPVYPNETVTVVSEKIYFRFNKLKCKVRMHNEKNELVCKGVLSGMLIGATNA